MKRRFKKYSFRTMGVILGLWLGWQAAVLAEEQSHDGSALAPSDATSGWFPMVIALVVVLFVAAILIGPLAMKLKGEEPAEPADDHHGDDHGH